MRRDLHSKLMVATAIAAAVLSATPTALEVDTQGYSSIELVLSVGAGGITFDDTNKVEFKVEHSDDGSDWSDVVADDILGQETVTTGIVKALTAVHASAGSYRFGYIGPKRYVRVTPVFSGTHGSPTPLAGTWLLSNAAIQPVADQA